MWIGSRSDNEAASPRPRLFAFRQQRHPRLEPRTARSAAFFLRHSQRAQRGRILQRKAHTTDLDRTEIELRE